MSNILSRFRSDILAITTYSSARSQHLMSEEEIVFLDANECGYEPYIGAQNLSRYPTQQPQGMMDSLCRLYDLSSRNLLITRGADEAIDVLVRSCCRAEYDNIIICPPTFPMYEQAALLQGAQVILAPLKGNFDLDSETIKTVATPDTKIIFICTPNNPTASVVPSATITDLCRHFADTAFIVVDETYIEFAGTDSMLPLVETHQNLIVLRTLSKAYAAAGLRSGVAIGQADVINIIRKTLAPYPIPQPVAAEVVTILNEKNTRRLKAERLETLKRRDNFTGELRLIPSVVWVYPSYTNFVLVKFTDANTICELCRQYGIILRDQNHQMGLANCVRIAIGTDTEMQRLLCVLRGDPLLSSTEHRRAKITRKTNETTIDVKINLDAPTPIRIATGIGFYDHMLEQIAKHGGFALTLECTGDLHIDPHHTIEDCAIVIGTALRKALGDKRGIGRYGFVVPMDEAEAACSIDLSGRTYLKFNGNFSSPMLGDLPTDLIEHVFRSFAENLAATLHISVKGENTHHMVEACFKALGRTLRQAIAVDGSELPSSKGIL